VSSGVHVVLAAREHRDDLERFPCCSDRVVYGKRRPQCTEKWSHQVQSYVRARVLKTTSGAAARAADHRLLLVYDGEVLVGVGAHLRVLPVPDDVAASREIDIVAVRTEMRARQLSDGSRCSDTVLGVVLEDAARREPELTHVRAQIHRLNAPSLGLVRRHGALIADAAHELHTVLVPVRPALTD
jgi:hypothetical protein